jgi:capsular exopolysaccharide synthesis family protein
MINFSELLWKPKRVAGERTSASSSRASEITDAFPELNQVPIEQVDVRPETRIALFNDPRSPGADRFRFLRMRLREIKDATNLRSMVITSPLPQDGKSTVAINLVTALAEKGRRNVLLIDADLYHPSVCPKLALSPRRGLSESIENGLDPLSVISRLEPLGWYLLAAGTPQGNPTEIVQSDALAGIIGRLSSIFEWIVIDTPPVAPLTDAISISRNVDASLLVARADRTPREAIDQAISLLGRKHVVGILLNAADGLNQVYSEYYGYYGNK